MIIAIRSGHDFSRFLDHNVPRFDDRRKETVASKLTYIFKTYPKMLLLAIFPSPLQIDNITREVYKHMTSHMNFNWWSFSDFI